jgi:hypothetical protein
MFYRKDKYRPFHRTFNASRDALVFRSSSPIESLLIRRFKDSDSCTSLSFDSDVSLLFDQKRLDSIGNDTVRNWIDSLGNSSDSFNDLKSKLNDTQLISYVKSRRLQSLSELRAWCAYLDADARDLKASKSKSEKVEKSDEILEKDD